MANSGTAEPGAFGPARLEAALRQMLQAPAPGPLPPLIVAYSGGADSTALLHALRRCTAGEEIRAIHVHHGLHPDADRWATHCLASARSLGVPCETVAATVDADAVAAQGVEGAARQARYAVLAAAMQAGECLLTAQHLEDQAETVLLQLLRGAGLPGLAAMPAVTEFGAGRLLRPLLEWRHVDLLLYLRDEGIDWIEDPANRDLRFDRSFLRSEILPTLLERWPAAATNAARAARHLAEGARLLEQLAAADLAAGDAGDGRLDVARIGRLTPERQRNALRHWMRSAGFRVPDTVRLERVLGEVIGGAGAGALVATEDAEIRRYGGRLYLSRRGMFASPPPLPGPIGIGEIVHLPDGLGTLELRPGAGTGLAPELIEEGCRLRWRTGGERLRPVAARPRRTLKRMFQEAGIVPWMRERIPLLYCGDRLVAVADLWLEASCRRDGGIEILWNGHPPLY